MGYLRIGGGVSALGYGGKKQRLKGVRLGNLVIRLMMDEMVLVSNCIEKEGSYW